MEPFEYRGKTLEVWTQSGTVLSTSKHSRTDVASYGGGGWVGPKGGSVSAPTIVSSTTTEQEIWIRQDSGQETAIQLSGVDVPVRAGQRVTFVAAKQPWAKNGFWVTLVNHSADRHWPLSSNAELSAQGRLGAYPLLKLRDFLAAAAIFVVLFLAPAFSPKGLSEHPTITELAPFGEPSLLIILPLGFLVLRTLLAVRRKDRIFAALDAWVERNVRIARSIGATAAGPAIQPGKVA